MDARPWESSANQYYAFGGEKLDLLPRISKTPPPPSARSSRSPLPAAHHRKSTPTPPMFASSSLPKSRLLDRISPKGYPPHSKRAKDLPPLSPELGDYLDSQLGDEEEEEEEQVIRVLDNNKELVYERESKTEERQDRDEDPPEPRTPSSVKKRKLVHPNQSTSTFTPLSSPVQNDSNLKATHSRSRSRTPPLPHSPSKKQPPGSRPGVDWSSGSPKKGGSSFGKLSGLTFGFAGHGHDTSPELNTTGRATSQAHPPPKDDTRNSRRSEEQFGARELGQSPTTMVAQDRSEKTRNRPREEDENFSGGTSLLRRVRSHAPIFDPELEVPLEGGEDHDSRHEAGRKEGERTGCDTSPITPPPVPPPRPKDLRMDSPPPLRESPPRTPSRGDPPEGVAHSQSVASSRVPTSPPKSGTPLQPEETDEAIKSMEQHAEDLLQDIQKEFLSRTEAQAMLPPAGRIIPGSSSMPLRGHGRRSRMSPTPILDGMSPLAEARSVSPIDRDYITSDAISTPSHTPRSPTENFPTSISRSASDPDPKDSLFGVDPELDQITNQALGDLIVHHLKLNHSLDANDAVQRAIKREVDGHARAFLSLATRLARRMDLMGEPLGSTEASDIVQPTQLLSESVPPDTIENGYLEHLPPVEGSEGNEGPQPSEEDIQRIASDVEMDAVPPEVPQSDSEDKVKAEPDDEPVGEQELDVEPTDEHVEDVDHAEYGDEDGSQEPGLEIPGVWCARTGKDRTDTIQEHVEISEVLAMRVKKWVKKTGGSEE
jgi:hypothetical protein